MAALDGVRLKLERAESVIDELNEAVIAYLAEKPYKLVGEFDRESSEYVVRGKVTKSTAYLSVLAGDVAHDLRSSLDHLAWQLALLNTATPYDRTQFPIALSPGEFNSKTGQKMIGNLSPKHRALIETFQPYNGGDPSDDSAPFTPHALRDLRILSNTDKHRLLNTTVVRKARQAEPRDLGLDIVQYATGLKDVEWFSRGTMDDAVIVRMTLEGAGPDPKVRVKGEMPVTVTLDDPSLTTGEPGLIPLLSVIVTSVREVVAAFESDL